ncbi:glutamate--tRNA ligase family protein [Arsenicibacter rosenii]|uniref:Glutamyl/glutaminyl-tRNA synthetase class Ib catalytic domain-containing protein n=1 Tax=Arsenicibacter rosenii TaxID=1750698 RepID=A0A1S2VRG2_9BACT|nr:glutamate--tRNA ligase family protein [Arsenicibacter rosenii]OIN60806.1 hypothetical protein BLX24_01535 [Arsenicibacter rosenii]
MANQHLLFRYAPTPSGYLHVGNGINFVLNYVLARQLNARILLRIDDLDADRKRPEYVRDVFDCIDYLGLTYDLGPAGPDDFEARWSQIHRRDLYEQQLQQLRTTGKIFASLLSRKQLQAHGNRYPTDCRLMGAALDRPETAWRISVDEAPLWRLDEETDFVVRRRDGVPAYQVASLTDDIFFGVTHLIRGEDLQLSTRMQAYLANLLLPANEKMGAFLGAQVWHHPLIQDAGGRKLSKSAGSTALTSWRQAGIPPVMVYREAARVSGISPAGIQSLTDLEQAISVVFQTVKES